MTETMNVMLPTGMRLTNVPVGTTKREIVEKLRRNGYDVTELEPFLEPIAQTTNPPLPQALPDGSVPLSSPSIGRGEAAARSARQGLLFGFGDEITSGLAALASYPILAAQGQLRDRTLGDLYESALEMERESLVKGRESFPVQSALSEIGGSLLTGAGSARALSSMAPKAMGAISTVGSRNPLKTASSLGALSGALYGAGEAEGGLDDRVSAALPGAVLGGVGGAGGGLLASRFASRGARRGIPTAEGLRKNARDLYQQATEAGGKLKVAPTRNLFNKISVAVAPKTQVEKTLKGENIVGKSIDELTENLKGGASFDELHSLEKVLGEMANDNVVAATGKLNATGNSFKTAQKELRKFIDDVDPADLEGGKLAFDLKKEADKQWSRSLRLNEVEKIMTRASLQEQPSTALRTGFRGILANPNRRRNFTKDELKSMRKAAELDLITGGLRNMGGRIFPAFTTGGASIAALSNPLSLGVVPLAYTASGLARMGANARQLSKANALARLIENPDALRTFVRVPSLRRAGIGGGMLGARPMMALEEQDTNE